MEGIFQFQFHCRVMQKTGDFDDHLPDVHKQLRQKFLYQHVGKKSSRSLMRRGFFYFSFNLKLLLLLFPITVLHRSHQHVINVKKS